jgi:5-phospho-D-xylono-1,4-lactonase
MPGSHVVTVNGPLPTETLGVVDAHDHLFIASPALPGGEILDPDRVTAEVLEARASGIGAIVEMTPIGLGRRPDLLRRVSLATGMPVIAATGYHRDAHYPAGHWVHDAPVERLADRVIVDLARGMHPADWEREDVALDPARAGVIKAGASYQRISRGERRRLEAAAAGSRAAGVAVLVHAEIGTCGHEIVDVLEGAGATPDRILLAHMDRNPDPELHAEIAARGVTLEYDTVGRVKYRPDSDLLDLIERVVAAGHGERIVLGMDLGTRDYYRAYEGGPGMRYLMTTFVPRLRRRIGDAATDAILVGNPARVFAVTAVAGTTDAGGPAGAGGAAGAGGRPGVPA